MATLVGVLANARERQKTKRLISRSDAKAGMPMKGMKLGKESAGERKQPFELLSIYTAEVGMKVNGLSRKFQRQSRQLKRGKFLRYLPTRVFVNLEAGEIDSQGHGFCAEAVDQRHRLCSQS